MSKYSPPKNAERFFRWFCHHSHLEGLEGDLYELFEIRVKDQGVSKARLYYVVE